MRNLRYSILSGFVALLMLMSGAALLSVAPMVTAAPIVYSFNSTGTLTTNTVTHLVTLSGESQTGVVRTDLSGAYMRVKLDVAGTLTPTVKATLR